jgi:hypothetical protein
MAGVAAAQDVDTSRFWSDLQNQPVAPGRALRLDVTGLRRYLRAVPLESAQRALPSSTFPT